MRFSSVHTAAGNTLAVRRDDGLYDLRSVDPTLPDGVGQLVAGGPEAGARAAQAAKSVTARAQGAPRPAGGRLRLYRRLLDLQRGLDPRLPAQGDAMDDGQELRRDRRVRARPRDP